MLLVLAFAATLLSLLIFFEVRRLRQTMETQVEIFRRVVTTTRLFSLDAVERAQTSAEQARRNVAEILNGQPEKDSGTSPANSEYLHWYQHLQRRRSRPKGSRALRGSAAR